MDSYTVRRKPRHRPSLPSRPTAFLHRPEDTHLVALVPPPASSSSPFSSQQLPQRAVTMSPTDEPCVCVSYKNSHYLVPVEFILRVHPGGRQLILQYVNQDITQAFVDARHSDMAVQLLEQWMEGSPAGPRRLTPSAAAMEAPLNGHGSEGLSGQLIWNALVFGIAGASVTAAVLCRR